jgi:hypothetical protein
VACHAGIQPVVEALTLGYEMHLVAPFISVGFSKVQPKMCQPRRIVDIFLRKGKISQPGCQWCNPRVPVVQSQGASGAIPGCQWCNRPQQSWNSWQNLGNSKLTAIRWGLDVPAPLIIRGEAAVELMAARKVGDDGQGSERSPSERKGKSRLYKTKPITYQC